MADGYLNSGETFQLLCDGCGWPINGERADRGLDTYHPDCLAEMDDPEPLHMPSREFLVRQAILNAVPRHLPYAVKAWGVAGTLRKLGITVTVSHEMEAAILAAFRDLRDQWEAM